MVCLSPAAGRVGDDLAVGDSGVTLVDGRGQIESCFVGRLVETRESHTRVGGFHLRDDILLAFVGAQIEAAKLIVEMSGVFDVQGCGTGRKLVIEAKGRALVFFVQRNLGGLGLSARRRSHVMEVDLNRIQRDGGAGFAELEVDGLVAIKGVVGEVDVDGKGIVIGRRTAGQALRHRCAAGKQADSEDKQELFHRYTLSGNGRYPTSMKGNT